MERGEDVHCVGEAGLIDRLAEEVRMYIRQVIRRRISGDAAGIARALLLGERADLDRETMESFRLTGTIHVLALSGMHVGVIASGLALLTSRIRSRETGYVLFAVVLMLYDIVVGPSPSIVRASIMSVVIVGARLLGRRTDPLNSLCGAALIIVACDTYALFDVSFLLSFAAVAGIVLFGMPLAHSARVKRMGHARSLARAGAVTLGAQVGTTPIMLATFGAVPLFSVIANLAVVPTVSWGMIGAIGCVAVESLSPSIATTLGVGARVGLELAVTCSSALAPSMSATSFVSRIAMWEALASTVALVVVAASRSKPLRMASIGCAVALWCLPAIHGAGTDDGCVRITVMPTASSNVVMMSTASRIMVVYDGAVVSLARARSLLAGRVEDSAGVEWQDIREAPRSDEALFGTVRVVRSCRRAGESILRDGRYLAISIRPPAISAMTVVLDQNNCVVQHADR